MVFRIPNSNRCLAVDFEKREAKRAISSQKARDARQTHGLVRKKFRTKDLRIFAEVLGSEVHEVLEREQK